MNTEKESLLLETPAGHRLLRHIQELVVTRPEEALELLEVLLHTGRSGVRAGEGQTRRAGDAPREEPKEEPREAPQVPQDEPPAPAWASGDGIHYKGPEPRQFAQKRRLKSRRAYTAERMPARSIINSLTPAQQKILFTLVNTPEPMSVEMITQATELATKTVENSLSLLRARKLLSTH